MMMPRVIKEQQIVMVPLEARVLPNGTMLPEDTVPITVSVVQAHDVDKIKSVIELCCLIAGIFVRVFYKATFFSAVTRLIGNWSHISRAIALAAVIVANIRELKDELFDITADEVAEIYTHLNKVVMEEFSDVR